MLSIGEASRQSGVKIETIRYYEREGILPPPPRTASGRRLYDADGLARLVFIKRCRDLGFSIPDARALMSLATDGNNSCENVKPIAQSHLAKVEDKLAELVQLRNSLSSLISLCGDSTSVCPMLEVFSAQPGK